MRHLRWLLIPIVLVPLVLVLSYGFGRDPAEIPSQLIGKTLPSFRLVTLDGQTVTAEELRGKPVLINFWASWCAPCVAEHAILRQAQRRYGDRVTIVGILYQDTAGRARSFVARYGGDWPVLLDPGGTLALDFGVTGPPESYFVDAAGIIRAKQFGPLTDATLEARVSLLLATARIDR
jgi:cytochrome c biogenesis protein CcmG/thiol:disulfide interchange protein DsbE